MQARQSIEPLIRMAAASLDRLFLAVGGAGCCVLLADRNGVSVDRRGAPADDKTFHAWGLWQRAVWSENNEGTNGYHAYPAHAAFGGYKQSGIGRETHKMMLDHYQQTKNILVSYSPKKLGFF